MERKCADLEKKLGARDLELERLRTSFSEELGARDRDDKQLDQLHAEIESLCLERDQLIDQLAVLSGELAQARSHSEKLEASLRAARGALTPLPEGERALRAEVVGLRGRLEDLEAENQHLTGRISSLETELAIERARVEDRQQEVCGLLETQQELEARLAENEQTVENALVRQREMLVLTTRLQEENEELRAAQLALQETLQARDLEIAAREEHLAVTKRGLASRDREILELEERLQESERAREALKTDLQRLTLDQQELIGKLAHRETRIATLTRTLARVEEVIGHPISPTDPTAHPLPRAEWTRSGPTDRARESVAPPLASTGPEAGSSDTESGGEDSDDPDPAPAASSGMLLGLWRDRRFSELLGRDGIRSTADFFADSLIEAFGHPPSGGFRLKSLGGERVDAEVQLARALEARGISETSIRVLDCDPGRADLRRQAIERAGRGESIEVLGSDDQEDWKNDAACNAVLLADALRGIPELGSFLDDLAPIVEEGALLLFVDRIASGPLQLSASARMRLEEVWSTIPGRLAACEAFAPLPRRGEDDACPDDRIDPGTALRERFHARVIAGFGHLIDLLVDPRCGSALPVEDDVVIDLLDAVMEIDESRSRIEGLPPRHGLAIFGPDAAEAPRVLGQAWPAARTEGTDTP
ncbi:MAG TPA: hypothetical protein ENI85_03625 [Deltaproteobacteria bacterium]|nr:hypothetical protein [Deltaproteobacteria bacterium]